MHFNKNSVKCPVTGCNIKKLVKYIPQYAYKSKHSTYKILKLFFTVIITVVYLLSQ